MSDRRRLLIASACSVFLHAAVIASVCSSAYYRPFSFHDRDETFSVTFRPTDSLQPRQLVNAAAPTDEVVNATDLIAVENTKAQDMADTEGDANAPHVDKLSDFNEVGLPPPPPLPTSPDLTVPPPEPPAPEPKPEQNTTPIPESTKTPEPTPPVKSPDGVQLAIPGDKPAAENSADAPAQEPLQLAQAMPALPPSMVIPGETQGRVDGGVKREGILGFEAMENELAPYLKEIRERVELNWRAALQMRYSGTSPTKAVLDCAIRPNGQIESVVIVESGDSATYAPLCKEAIEKAGPFQPFPFKVPDMYRNKNLEIRWTFSFLRK